MSHTPKLTKMKTSNTKSVCQNRKARHDYFILDEYEAGMVLLGTEIKSLRLGRANLKDSYAQIRQGEVYLENMHIGAYPFAAQGNHDPLRSRKLLLHKEEIKRLTGKVKEKGQTLVPLRVYLKGGKAKVVLALAKGKRKYDKREAIRKREEEREMQREKRKITKA
jgi:SsrA-binding protein